MDNFIANHQAKREFVTTMPFFLIDAKDIRKNLKYHFHAFMSQQISQ